MHNNSDDNLDAETAPPRKWSLGKRFGCMGLILLILFGCLELISLQVLPKEDTRRLKCKQNIKLLGFALHNYHDAFGTFPPAYIADKNGKPMHSWRVLLLPMLDERELYNQYRFDEPWDGPNNRKLHDKMPSVFQCLSDEHEKGTQFTNYVAVAGENTAWPHARGTRLSEMKDGFSNTILIVETKNSSIHWMEPRDLEFDKMSFKINDSEKPGISSGHKKFTPFHRFWQADTPLPPQVLMGNGAVRSLPLDITQETLKALLTINGGETVPPDYD